MTCDMERIEADAAAAIKRNAEQRATNRARFPEFAAMTDKYGWKLLWAKDADGEIGKTPELPAGVVWLDWTHAALIEAGFGQTKGKRR
jgi:hypothetical protein